MVRWLVTQLSPGKGKKGSAPQSDEERCPQGAERIPVRLLFHEAEEI